MFLRPYQPRQQLVAAPRWQCGMAFIFVVASQAFRSVGARIGDAATDHALLSPIRRRMG